MTLSQLAQHVEIRSKPGSRVPPSKQEGWQQQSRPWTCTLTYQGRRLTVDFWQGTGIKGAPSSSDVLSSLLTDASVATNSRDFDDFCSELGYDPEQPSSRRTYRACVSVATKLEKLLGSDYDMFMRSENDV